MTLDKPRRRTYVTGDSLPSLTTSFRSFNVAPNEDDADLGAVRAFNVNVRNISNTEIYLKESSESDEITLSAGENRLIYEPNGIKDVLLRGKNGDEAAEINAIVAHNDFDITNKIDGFLRTFAQSIGSTRIGGQGQFDVRTLNREGYNKIRHLREAGLDGDNLPKTWTLYNEATFDGSVESFHLRTTGTSLDTITFDLDGIGARVEIDKDSTGTWEVASPQRAHSAFLASKIGGQDVFVGNRSSARECIYTYTPDPGIFFEEGDSVRIVVHSAGNQGVGSGTNFDVEMNVEINQRQRL